MIPGRSNWVVGVYRVEGSGQGLSLRVGILLVNAQGRGVLVDGARQGENINGPLVVIGVAESTVHTLSETSNNDPSDIIAVQLPRA